MDLCLMIEGQNGVTWPQWLALARACEEHGIPALFRSDHQLNLGGEEAELGSLDAWGTLCALAATTTTLRLGTLVSPATFRHPANVAKLAATADQVSGGRVSLGLGAGWHEREHEAFGFPFAATRAERRSASARCPATPALRRWTETASATLAAPATARADTSRTGTGSSHTPMAKAPRAIRTKVPRTSQP